VEPELTELRMGRLRGDATDEAIDQLYADLMADTSWLRSPTGRDARQTGLMREFRHGTGQRVPTCVVAIPVNSAS
jgi:hypothetical protein